METKYAILQITFLNYFLSVWRRSIPREVGERGAVRALWWVGEVGGVGGQRRDHHQRAKREGARRRVYILYIHT